MKTTFVQGNMDLFFMHKIPVDEFVKEECFTKYENNFRFDN